MIIKFYQIRFTSFLLYVIILSKLSIGGKINAYKIKCNR